MKIPELILSNNIGVLSTCDEHCKPSAATLFYAVRGGKLYFFTHEDSVKIKHIHANPSVCLVVSDHTNYRQAQVYATAKIIEDPSELLKLLENVINKEEVIKSDYLIPYMYIESEGSAPVVVEMEPKSIRLFQPETGITQTSA